MLSACISGSPLAASPTAPGLKFHLPPFKPNHNQGIKAEELLKMLVNPIDFDLTEDYLHPENFPKSGPFFDVHRTKNVTALKGVTTNLVCRVRRLGNHTVIMHYACKNKKKFKMLKMKTSVLHKITITSLALLGTQ